MPSRDKIHFDEYTPQTRAKHQILTMYLPAFLTALKGQADRFHYIDGFAGRGRYEGTHPGSPLLALEEIGKAGVASRTSVSLVEENPQFLEELTRCVSSHPVCAELRDEPFIRLGGFAQWRPELLQRPVYSDRVRVATFAFVDPCGIDGVGMSDLCEILGRELGEVLLFFNYDGVNRVLGGIRAGSTSSDVLERLFGSADAVRQLLVALDDEDTDRERVILAHFLRAIRARSRAMFFVPFRIEAGVKRTSHYLLHCSSHRLAFKIMKSVMDGVGNAAVTSFGKLEMLTERSQDQGRLFDLDIEAQKDKIVDRVRNAPCRVKEFTEAWMYRPDDLFSEPAYKQMLLRLEEEGRLVVWDKADRVPSPASKRRKATLGPEYWLRVP